MDDAIAKAPKILLSGILRLTPLDRRRLDNFKANRRGFWAFWLFLAMFLMSLGSEFLANDRPILAYYKGELLAPAFVTYPEEKFGGFLARTDYRDPTIAKEIDAHGWMLWPPIRYSYDTHNLDLPTPAPSPPTWLLSKQQCDAAAAKKIAPGEPNRGCADIEWNWLGTDDQGRDVVARLLYGFRLSVLFGLILATVSSAIGVAAGAIQGYFGAGSISFSSASSKSGRRCRSFICSSSSRRS